MIVHKLRHLFARARRDWWLPALSVAGVSFAVLNAFGLLQRLAGPATLVLLSAILIYLVVERRDVLDDIKVTIRAGTVRHFDSRDALYVAASRLMAELVQAYAGPRVLLHASLHGTEGPRLPDPDQPSEAIRAFDSVMDQYIKSSGVHGWQVKVLLNVPNEPRLDEILERLNCRSDADGYEVKAFAIAAALPNFTPLIVGDENCFLAAHDRRYYRARAGVWMRGREATRFLTEYFDSLWNDPRAFHIRKETGVDDAAVAALRQECRR